MKHSAKLLIHLKEISVSWRSKRVYFPENCNPFIFCSCMLNCKCSVNSYMQLKQHINAKEKKIKRLSRPRHVYNGHMWSFYNKVFYITKCNNNIQNITDAILYVKASQLIILRACVQLNRNMLHMIVYGLANSRVISQTSK